MPVQRRREKPVQPLRSAAVVLAVGAGLLLAACGSDDEPSAAGQQGSSVDVVATAEEAVTRNFEGTDRKLPDGGPSADAGKTVWVLAANLASEGSRVTAEGAEEAGKALGWSTNVVDAEFDPNVASQQIRSAVSAEADAIMLLAVDCAWAPGALADAEQAGVAVYSLYGLDCDEPLFDAELQYGPNGEGFDAFATEQLAPAVANHVIAETVGKAKIVQLRLDEIAALKLIGDAFAETIEQGCPDCEIVDQPITGADMAQDRVQAKVSAAMTREPDANVVMSPLDGLILLGAGAAVGQADAQGRELLLTGLEGFVPNLKMIAAGGPQDFAVGQPSRWAGWAAMDGLNRLFSGEDQVDSGIGYQAIDEEHPPPSVPYDGNERSLGWEDHYQSIWRSGGAG